MPHSVKRKKKKRVINLSMLSAVSIQCLVKKYVYLIKKTHQTERLASYLPVKC